MKHFLLISILIFFMISCNSQNCKEFAHAFAGYKTAIEQVEKSSFTIKESIDTSKSSWISGLSFYSCNKKTGFLIMETKSKKYIHQEVPI